MGLKRLPITKRGSEPFVEFTNTQLHIMWFPDEIKVEKDIQDVMVNFTPAEKHGVITVLKLFTLYEDFAGEEYWGGRFKKMFNDDIEAARMASAFSMIENCVHGPFYRKINELLHIDTPDFYLSYIDNPTLKGRMDHIGDIVDDPDDLVSIGMFSLVEGVALYANFSFLKHFQSQGKNKLMNLVRGINFSLRDENCLHPDTEVLTQSGWVKIKDVKVGDSILAYTPDSGKMEYQNTLKTFTTNNKEFYTFSSDNLHQVVTPEHRMITDSGVVFAKDSTEDHNYILSGYKIGTDSKLTDEDKVMLTQSAIGKRNLDWFYTKLNSASSDWAHQAKNYLISNT